MDQVRRIRGLGEGEYMDWVRRIGGLGQENRWIGS